MEIVSRIKRFIYFILNYNNRLEWKQYNYEITHLPSKKTLCKVAEMRKKEKIKVAFIVYDIPKWKTEDLYLKMLTHPRFEPVIVLVMIYQKNYLYSIDYFNRCKQYLCQKEYNYIVGSRAQSIDKLVSPDIVFYGEPYSENYDSGYTVNFQTMRESIGCYVPYSMHNTKMSTSNNHIQTNRVWRYFIENERCIEDLKDIVSNRCLNKVATGVPIQDTFLRAFKNHTDVWKSQDRIKKRIIWAPSHTIPSNGITNLYEQSTFLSIAEDMLRLAAKYKDSVQWVFKPHPALKYKLETVWGKEATDAYYAKWRELEYAQIEEGQYVDLFMSSDAMIHDCQSFIVEYMFTEKPVFYIDNKKGTDSVYNSQTRDAFALHYKGSMVEDIECFIKDTVLGGNDPMKDARIAYKQKYLIPPHGKTACENIINAILGEEEYSDCL